MAQPWKDPRTGTYYIRRRIPKDIRPLLPDAGETYKRPLGTKDIREAKTRFAAAWGHSEQFFLNARLQLPVLTPLPFKTLFSSPRDGRRLSLITWSPPEVLSDISSARMM
ncbi:DUF6538 domain-containing protein [Pseudomonas gingeri]|uniref:DUF6538 domain-containing protein n=1 Tax=Pseudomonas gingeri TaxID=117681 RepID=UPI00351C2546